MIWNMANKLKNLVKLEMNTVGHGMWQKTLKIVENENCTLQDLEIGEKLKNVENEI